MKSRCSLLLMAVLLVGCSDRTRRAAEVDRRGDHVMGFEHSETAHHFRLTKEGGLIEAEANDPEDAESRSQIRTHFAHIAEMFAAGDFEAPLLIHAETPPGVAVMKRLRGQIRYEFEPTERGGRVRIRTENSEALVAIHEFLRYQIRDHRTGDSGEIE